MKDTTFEQELRLCDVMKENLHNTMEKIKSTASDVMNMNIQWSDVEDHLKSSGETLAKRYREVVSKEVDLRKQSFDLEERVKVVEAAEAEMLDLEMKATDYRSEVEEKGEQLGLLRKSLEDKTGQLNELLELLRNTGVDFDLKGEQLRQMETDFERYHVEVNAEKEHLGMIENDRRELEADIEQKRKDLTFIVDKITECEQLYEKKSSEVRTITTDLQRQRDEISSEREHLDKSQTRSRELQQEIEEKTKDRRKILDQIAESGKQLELADNQLDSQQKLIETRSAELRKIQTEIELKEKQLEHMDFVFERQRRENSTQLKHLYRSQTRTRELNEEIERKREDFTSRIAEYEKELKSVEEQLASQQELLEKQSLELVSIKKETGQQLQSKNKELEEIEGLIQERTDRNESIKLLLKEHSEELASKEKRQNQITEAIHKLSLEIVSKETAIQQLSEKYNSKQKKLDLIDAEFVLKEKELCSVKDTYLECLQNWEIKEKEIKSLEEEAKKIRESLNDFQSKESEQLKLKASLMEREKELALKEKAFRARSENIELKKKKLDAREEWLNKKDEQLKSEEQKLGKCVKDYELKTKQLDGFFQQNKPGKQVDLVRDASVRDEKTLQLPLHERKQIFFGLQGMNDPAGYVLNLVKDELMSAQRRGELSLTEPIVKHLVSLLEELPHVVRSSKHLLSDALQVADLWSRMLDNSSQMSPLEVWGFLQLILAYELVYITNRDITLRFALKVAHFKQAPKLFEALGLSYAILGLVTQLLEERHYLLATRFILYFNLTYNFNALKFLKDEIVTLRLSAKDNRRFNSQAEAAKLKDIIELILDFKLEIDLPVELIVKFMVPREIQNQNPYVVSSIVPIQPTFPTILGGSTTQQVLQLETYQAGGSTVVHGQSSHQAGFKRPRVDTSVSGHVIRPCFNQSSYDRF